MEAKIDTLTSQLPNLALIVKKRRTAGPSQDFHIGEDNCSYYKKAGHGLNRCPENPNRDTRCPRFGNMAHLEATCLSRRKIEEPKVNVALEETDEIDTDISV